MISCIFYENSCDNNAKLQIMGILMSTFICQLWDDLICGIMLIIGGFPIEIENQISNLITYN